METFQNNDFYKPGEKLLLPRLPRSLPFDELVFILETRITEAIDLPYPFEHIHSPSFYFSVIRPLVASLIVPYDEECDLDDEFLVSPSKKPCSNNTPPTEIQYSFTDQHRGIVAALLVARLEFLGWASDGGKYIQGPSPDATEEMLFKERGVLEARAFTAELVAMKFLSFMTIETDRIEFLTYEYSTENEGVEQSSPPLSSMQSARLAKMASKSSDSTASPSKFPSKNSFNVSQSEDIETTPLLSHSTSFTATSPLLPASWGTTPEDRLIEHSLFVEEYADQSSLDLALAGSQPAREFLTCTAVQSVVSGIWSGRIMYWETIGVGAKKNVHLYDPSEPVDWYSRLRVPRYRAFFMMINYTILLALFYTLLFRKNKPWVAVTVEFFLNVWFLGFVLDELSQVREAGSLAQYFGDFWSLFDLCIVGIFMLFAGLRFAGFMLGTDKYAKLSLDILSLEALLLIPRMFSFLSMFPYFGTLLPCLRDIAAEFFKFLVIIIIIYVGFLTTFTFLGRESYTFENMSWLLVRVFFGSSYAGFDAAPTISPIFGPPLMLIFVTLTNILLITVLISILSQKFSDTMLHAKQEYAVHFSSAVAESVNTSDRVTYFYPPINILAVLMRPLRMVLDHDEYRNLRIRVLRATHWPFVVVVWAFEIVALAVKQRRLKRYWKIRKDRRYTVAQRLALQQNEPFYSSLFSADEDNDPERSTPRRRHTTYGHRQVPSKPERKRIWRNLTRAKTFVPNRFAETFTFRGTNNRGTSPAGATPAGRAGATRGADAGSVR